jgi:hypothetical protein
METWPKVENKLTRVIREHVRASYIEPAIRKGDPTVAILAGDIVKDLHLTNRTPAVCSALRSRAFLKENRLAIEKDEGPPKGVGTSVRITYRLSDVPRPPTERMAAFDALRGLGKQTYAALGGGEAHLRAEREAWGD